MTKKEQYQKCVKDVMELAKKKGIFSKEYKDKMKEVTILYKTWKGVK